jgi:poly(hydroxyalkanoate) depolymerase family esterase
MQEAMRLMRAGDLTGATAAIQRGLGAQEPASTPQRPRRQKRRYELYVPSTYDGQPLPLIVMLHGCTQTAADFATGTRMNEVAEERGCFVLYPEQTRSANQQKCWNWFNTGSQLRDMGEPAAIAGLIREVSAEHAIDASRVYVAGLSAGGAMAVILGRTYPELFAAVGVHSGLPYGAAHDLPSALAAMRSGGAADHFDRPLPTIVFHGDRDATVHPVNGEKVAEQALGPCTCDVEHDDAPDDDGERTVTRKLFKDEGGAVIVESWLIHGAAHKWSGGDPRGSHTDAAGPDASREMARFFLERSRQ